VYSSSSKEELNVLIKKFKDGDQSAFDEIYKLCYCHITFLCSKLCDDEKDVEEIVQDTFTAAFKKAKELRGDTFLGLLRKIAARGCYAKRRKNQIEHIAYSDEIAAGSIELDKDFLPEEYLQNKESHFELLRIINELPPKQKEMIYLYYYADINTEEIAKLHNCPSANVRQLLHVARNKIKDKIEKRANKKPSKRLAGMVGVSLASILSLEEEIFSAGYESLSLVGTLDAAVKAAGTSSAVGKICAVAACVAAVGTVSVMMYFSMLPAAEAYEAAETADMINIPVLESSLEEVELPAAEIPEEPVEEEFQYILDYEPESENFNVYETQELPPYYHAAEDTLQDIAAYYTEEAEEGLSPENDIEKEEPYFLEEEPEEPKISEELEAIEEPEEKDELYEPDPIPIDRTQEILAELEAAATDSEVNRIITYYGFRLATQMLGSGGERFRFYVLDEGSGDILIGIAAHEYEQNYRRMNFEHYNNRQRPLDISELLIWMDGI